MLPKTGLYSNTGGTHQLPRGDQAGPENCLQRVVLIIGVGHKGPISVLFVFSLLGVGVGVG